MMSFCGADVLLGAPFSPLHGGGSLHYALAQKGGPGGTRSAAGSSSGFHSWTRTSVSSVSAWPSRFRRLEHRLAGHAEQQDGGLRGAAAGGAQPQPGGRGGGPEAGRPCRNGRAVPARDLRDAVRGAAPRHLLEDIVQARQRLDYEAPQREKAKAAAPALARFAGGRGGARGTAEEGAGATGGVWLLRRHHQEEEVGGPVRSRAAAPRMRRYRPGRATPKCNVTSARQLQSTLQSEEWF
ncbi:Neurofilament heavy polypeptide [Plecturocebus cupreus]